MGSIAKRYCDWCGADLGDTGSPYRLKITEEAASPVTLVQLDLCGTCLGLVREEVNMHVAKVQASWVVSAPEAKAPTMLPEDKL